MSTTDDASADPPATPTAPVTVVVAHGPGATRHELLDALHGAPDLDVVADLTSGEALVESIRELVPDVVLLSMELPHCEPIAVCDRMAELVPASRIALVFQGVTVSPVAITSGAVGAVSAADLWDGPADVIRRLASGEGFVPESWATWMLDEYGAVADGPTGGRGSPTLTATEQEVLHRLASGNTPAAIAAMHEVPVRLVRLHASYAMAKLHQAARDDRQRRAAS
jgi:DNA-binding NarL/FixJ family response regulator